MSDHEHIRQLEARVNQIERTLARSTEDAQISAGNENLLRQTFDGLTTRVSKLEREKK